MSTDLIRSNADGTSIVNPDSGEVLALADAPSTVIARVLGFTQLAIDQQLEYLYDVKRALGGELVERMDKAGEWTISAKGVKVTAPSPSAGSVDWDAEQLDEILERLVEEGVLDRDARLRTVERVTTLKVNKRAVTALQKIPAVRDAIAPAYRSNPPATRKASVRVSPRDL